nr:hypothetical protein [Chloroflexota bacterium]
MKLVRVAGALFAASLATGACSTPPGPSEGTQPRSTPDAGPIRSDEALGDDPLAEELVGPWLDSPIVLDEARIAIMSDACAAAAREKLGETEANLPTAIIDARGGRRVVAILADDLDAIECLAGIDAGGRSATVDSVERLSMAAVAPL